MSSKLEKENIFIALEGMEENISLLRRELEGMFGFQEPSLNLKPNEGVELQAIEHQSKTTKKKPPPYSKCAYCKKPVKVYKSRGRRSKHIFCDVECFAKYRKSLRIEKTCVVCKSKFLVPPSRSKTAKYCSLKCSGKGKSSAQVLRVCERCKKEYYVWPSVIKYGGGRFCSRECRNKGSKSENVVEASCLFCGEKFKTYTSVIKRNHGKFCSRKCYYKYKTAAMSIMEDRIKSNKEEKPLFNFLKIFKK